MRTATILLLAALSTCPIFAQQKATAKSDNQAKSAAVPALPANSPSRDQLIRLFDVIEIQKQMAGMANALATNMDKMMPASMGNISDKQKAGMTALNIDLFRQAMSPQFVDQYTAALIPIYQRHFTKAEVDDLISFYASPVGQKFLHEQPVLTQESLAQVMPLMQTRVQEVMDQMHYEDKLKEIFADEEKPAAPKQ